MPRYEKIADTVLRERVATAHDQIRSGKPSEAVRTLSDAFVDLIDRHPGVRQQSTLVRGRPFPLIARWPALGASLVLGPEGDGPARIEFARERFAVSEALTYFEFVVDLALGQGL
ncbi:MAG TPA: hypothetical protein VFH45_12945 [Acidimicrobiales bacterium]|nr:hypothetical protein [Acidimicrobiales bacterium]